MTWAEKVQAKRAMVLILDIAEARCKKLWQKYTAQHKFIEKKLAQLKAMPIPRDRKAKSKLLYKPGKGKQAPVDDGKPIHGGWARRRTLVSAILLLTVFAVGGCKRQPKAEPEKGTSVKKTHLWSRGAGRG